MIDNNGEWIEQMRSELSCSTKPVFATMRQLGENLGVSSHVVGRALKGVGLRTDTGVPTVEATRGGLARSIRTQDDLWLWVWNSEKTLEILSETDLDHYRSRKMV